LTPSVACFWVTVLGLFTRTTTPGPCLEHQGPGLAIIVDRFTAYGGQGNLGGGIDQIGGTLRCTTQYSTCDGTFNLTDVRTLNILSTHINNMVVLSALTPDFMTIRNSSFSGNLSITGVFNLILYNSELGAQITLTATDINGIELINTQQSFTFVGFHSITAGIIRVIGTHLKQPVTLSAINIMLINNSFLESGIQIANPVGRLSIKNSVIEENNIGTTIASVNTLQISNSSISSFNLQDVTNQWTATNSDFDHFQNINTSSPFINLSNCRFSNFLDEERQIVFNSGTIINIDNSNFQRSIVTSPIIDPNFVVLNNCVNVTINNTSIVDNSPQLNVASLSITNNTQVLLQLVNLVGKLRIVGPGGRCYFKGGSITYTPQAGLDFLIDIDNMSGLSDGLYIIGTTICNFNAATPYVGNSVLSNPANVHRAGLTFCNANLTESAPLMVYFGQIPSVLPIPIQSNAS
jgi:hypothetical protein